MRSPDAGPHAKRLKNSAACWTNMKGAGDDELAFTDHHALPRMDSRTFSLARYSRCGPGCGHDGALPPRLRSLRDRSERVAIDARRSCGHVVAPDPVGLKLRRETVRTGCAIASTSVCHRSTLFCASRGQYLVALCAPLAS